MWNVNQNVEKIGFFFNFFGKLHVDGLSGGVQKTKSYRKNNEQR